MIKALLASAVLAVALTPSPATASDALDKGVPTCVNEGELLAVDRDMTIQHVHQDIMDGYNGFLGDQWHSQERQFQWRIYKVCGTASYGDLRFSRPWPLDGTVFRVCRPWDGSYTAAPKATPLC